MNAPMQQAPAQAPSPQVQLRPQNVQQTPNVVYEGARLYNPPNLGYYWGLVADKYPELLNDSLKTCVHDAGDAFLAAFEAAIKGLHLVNPPPDQRLIIYRRKPVELWVEQRAKFPWRYLYEWQDWEKLEGRLLPQPPEMTPQGPDLSNLQPPAPGGPV